MFKLIVLDRDGVINQDSPAYIKSPEEWHAIPGSLEAIATLTQHGYKIAIATNQAGIARQHFTLETLELIHKEMLNQIAMVGGRIDGIFICPHKPEDNCTCRKPKPGLLLQAAQQFNVSPAEMLFIGDAMRDMLAAQACGVMSILVKTGHWQDIPEIERASVPSYSNLAEAVDLFILKN